MIRPVHAVLLFAFCLFAFVAIVPTSSGNTKVSPSGSPHVGASEIAKQQGPSDSESGTAEEKVATENEVESHADERRRLRGEPFIKNDAVIFGLLMLILGFVFWTSHSNIAIFKAFYHYVPMLLLCYFLPSLLTFFWIVDPEESKLYFVASRYLLPASLILLTLSIDLKGILGLGPKAVIMFLVGTLGVVLGGPIAVLLVSMVQPDWVGGQSPDEVWRGLTTVAGSWIGGGANQAAMKEVFEVGQAQYSAMVAVDVLVAEFWMVFLLLGSWEGQGNRWVFQRGFVQH